MLLQSQALGKEEKKTYLITTRLKLSLREVYHGNSY